MPPPPHSLIYNGKVGFPGISGFLKPRRKNGQLPLSAFIVLQINTTQVTSVAPSWDGSSSTLTTLAERSGCWSSFRKKLTSQSSLIWMGTVPSAAVQRRPFRSGWSWWLPPLFNTCLAYSIKLPSVLFLSKQCILYFFLSHVLLLIVDLHGESQW